MTQNNRITYWYINVNLSKNIKFELFYNETKKFYQRYNFIMYAFFFENLDDKT